MYPAITVLIISSFILVPLVNIRYSIIIMIFLSIMVPLSQGFEIFSLNFNVFRLLVLAGWIRIIFDKNLTLGKMEITDKAIIYWVIVSFMVYIIQQNNINAVINRLGFAYNVIGTYFLYRIIIKRKEDISPVFNTLIFIVAIVAIFMLIEYRTGKNMLSVFGTHETSGARMGLIRAQGPFAHSIYAGMFGATMLPLCFSMWRHKWGSAFLGIIGTLSAGLIVITSSSMTPLIASVSGFAALLSWPLRKHMRMAQYSILFTVVVLQIIMISPLWSFIKKVAFIPGSSGWHRFLLVDNLINRFNEWFLFGFSSLEKWGVGMEDKANQYYLEAVTGGFFKLALFIMIVVFSFNIIGKKIKAITDAPSQKKLWALGSALFANVVGFLGISYWDQMIFFWFLLLALITSACLIHGEKDITVDKVSKKFKEGQRSSLQY